MHVLSGLDHVRRHPERFLRSLPASGAELAERLAGDLLLLGGRRTLLLQEPRWFGVASDLRWLPTNDEAQLRRAFEKMRPFPEAGVNSVHSEILIGAFATNLVIITVPAQPIRLFGGSLAPNEALPGWVAQVVWFTVDAPSP
jgi:hypothetical protein